jgi:FAD/FMN-containing dehydrogenase
MDTHERYIAKKKEVQAQFARLAQQPEHPELSKDTSNLFRGSKRDQARLDVRSLNQVIAINPEARTVDVEGVCTYETLVRETLKYGLAPAIVPELKTITVGGAYAGIGVETASFRYGFMHETVLEADILTGEGTIRTCSLTQNRDLFVGFPNSYGSLGYALRVRLQLFAVKPYVKLERETFLSSEPFVARLRELGVRGRSKVGADIAFIEGTVFAPNRYVVSVGRYCEHAPYVRNIYKVPFYKTIPALAEDYLTVFDYFFRYDPDWFWCSRYLGMENPLVRALVGHKRMRSSHYYRVAAWSGKHPLVSRIRERFWRRESLIQDAEMPSEKALSFIEWFDSIIGMKPYLVAPIQQYSSVVYPLSPITPGKQFMNVGFYAPHKTNKPPLYYTKLIDQKILTMRARKMLYSVTTLSEQEFWTMFAHKPYEELKKKYDPNSVFAGLYEKATRVR